MGDAPASAATFGFAFRGQRIIAATLATLQTPQFGMTTGADILFAGCSAGARGAMFTLDYVAAMAPPGATVRGLLDSPLWVDVAPLSSNEVSLQAQTQGAYALINATARIPAACAATYTGTNAWKCLYGQYVLPYVTTPFFLNAAMFDSFQMLYDLGGEPPSSPGQVAFADAFQNATKASLWAATLTNNLQNGIFSATCLTHCLTDTTATLQGVLSNGVSIQSALNHWLSTAWTETPATATKAGQTVDVSQCMGYPCVGSCPGGSSVMNLKQATSSYAQLSGQAISTESSGNDDGGQQGGATGAGGNGNWGRWGGGAGGGGALTASGNTLQGGVAATSGGGGGGGSAIASAPGAAQGGAMSGFGVQSGGQVDNTAATAWLGLGR